MDAVYSDICSSSASQGFECALAICALHVPDFDAAIRAGTVVRRRN